MTKKDYRSGSPPVADPASLDPILFADGAYWVQEAGSRQARRAFMALPYRLYRHDVNYVPPLRSQVTELLDPGKNTLLAKGPFVLLLCRHGRKVVGRVLVGIDLAYDQANQYHSAWFSLFESVQDQAAAQALLTAMTRWARAHGADFLRGPEPADGGDTSKGLLVLGFDGPPALKNSYNPPWYRDFFEQQGFVKLRDLYAYRLTVDQVLRPRDAEILAYAMKRYGYHVDCINLADMEPDLVAITEILQQTVVTWQTEHGEMPDLAAVRKMAQAMLPIADPELICLARTDSGRPIGFLVALPDYNQVFQHIRDGHLWPIGLLKMLYYRRKITAVRVFMQFVVPDFHKKAVNNAMFARLSASARRKGYHDGDGSTIDEANLESRRSVERLGGVLYRTYRIYKKSILPQDG